MSRWTSKPTQVTGHFVGNLSFGHPQTDYITRTIMWSVKKEQKGRSPPRMDGSVVFARWRQCVSHLIQCFLGSTQVHIQNGISIGSAVFAQLTAGSSHSLQWTAISPQKSFPGESGPHLIHDSLGLPESTTQTVSRSVQPFLHGSRS